MTKSRLMIIFQVTINPSNLDSLDTDQFSNYSHMHKNECMQVNMKDDVTDSITYKRYVA